MKIILINFNFWNDSFNLRHESPMIFNKRKICWYNLKNKTHILNWCKYFHRSNHNFFSISYIDKLFILILFTIKWPSYFIIWITEIHKVVDIVILHTRSIYFDLVIESYDCNIINSLCSDIKSPLTCKFGRQRK